MASGGDMKIAVAIQDLTKEGLKRIEQNLRKIPSSIGIDVKSTMGDFKAIKKLKKDMVEAGAQTKLLNGALDKVGKGTLSGLLADAKRFERNMKVVRESIAKIGELGNKADSNRLLSRFSGFDKGTQIAAITNFRDKMADVRSELDKLNRTPRFTKSWNTEKIAQHREQVRALTAEYNRYESVVRRMEGILSRQASETKRLHNQQQQSLRTIDSASARNSGAFQKADFDDYLRRFRIMSSSQRLDEIEAKKRARDRAKTDLYNEQYKLERIDPSNTQAVARQVQVVTQLRAEYNALNSELKRLRTTQEQLNRAEKKADTKAAQQRLRAERKEAKRAQQEQKKALQESKQAAAQYRAELNNVQVAMRSTSQFASQMREDIQQAFSYYALKQFLSNLIEIGGQFEYQRRAIANILQDTTKANTLFNQIKELGVKSPFSTLELDSYAKQLSAFDIPYHKMYDTLKKMADIAAGTGADMSRIILAYGHVKAEGFLTGVQRRQFSNANINMVGGLADYYSKLEGQRVTKRDVYRRIHDKQVSFEDMDRVLMSMAEEGGQFYNMQEVMASTVKGTYKNLSDAINHMYMAIEKSANGPLMFFGKTLTSIIKLVESFPGAATRFVTAATAMAGIRALNAKRIQSESAMMVQKIALLDKEKIKLGILNKKDLIGTSTPFGGQALTKNSAQQLANLMTQTDASTKLLTVEAARTKEAVLAGIAHRKLNKELGAELVKMGAITQQELDRAVASRGVFRTIGRGFGSLFTTIKAGITSLWASVWPMLAIWGVVEAGMWAWNKLMNTEGEERKKAMIQSLADSYNSLKREMDGLPESFDNMYTDEVFQSIKDMVDIIKNELVDAELILGRVFEKDANGGYLYTTLEQAKMIRQELESAAGIREVVANQNLTSLFATTGFEDYFKKYNNSRSDQIGAVSELAIDVKYRTILNEFVKKHPQYATLDGARVGTTAYIRNLYSNSDARNAFNEFNEVTNKKVLNGQEYDKSIYLDVVTKVKQTKAFRALENELPAKKALNAVLNGLFNKWEKILKAEKGFETPEKRMKAMMVGIGLQQWSEEDKKYASEYLVQSKYPYLDKGKNDGNVQVPNAIYDKIMAKLGEMKDKDKIRLRSFNIQRTGSLADYYDAFTKDYKDLRGKMEEAYKMNAHLDFLDAEMLKNPTKITETYADPIKRQAVENWNKDVERYTTLLAAAKIAGYSEADLKEGMKGNKKDKWLEDQQVWFDTLKKAAKLYEDYAKVFGTENAFDMISSMPEFKDVLSGKSEETLAQLARTLEEYLANNSENFTTDDRKKFRNRVAQEQGELDLSDLKENQTRWIREIDKYMRDQLQRYDLYTEMYNATGSHSTAQQFAFGTEGSRQNYEDFVKAVFNSKFAERGLDYDTLAGWSEEQWKTKEGEEIRNVFEDAKKSIEQWKMSMNKAYINLLKNGKSYERVTQNILAQYTKDVEEIKNSNASQEDKDKMTAEAGARRDLALVDAKLTDLNFDKNFTSFNKQDFHLLALEIAMAIDKAFETGVIDRNTYNERKSSLMRMTRDYKSANSLPFVDSTTQAFITGGLPGYFEKVKQDWEVAQGEAAKDESYKETAEYKKAEKRAKKVFGEDGEDNGEGGLKELYDAMKSFTDTLLKGAKNTKAALDLFTNMFDALGNESMANVMGDASGVLGGALSGSSSLSFLGMEGKIAGAAIGTITAVAQTHDKSINRSIENSKRRIKELKSDYEAIEREQGRKLTNSGSDEKEKYNNLVDQKKELDRQLDLEREKKKEDKDAIRELEDQIGEMEDKIKYYWSDLLKEIYGLDFSSIADKLTDALTRAFENGENAAIAWRQAVGDIVRELASEILAQKYVKPMMDQLFEEAFGPTGKLANKTKLTEDDVKWLGDRLNSLGEDVIPQAEVIYKALQQAFPYSANSETVGGFTRLGEQLTEKTGTVLAGYINSIRADVSANRKSLNVVVERGVPALEGINAIAQSQLTQLNSIATNTKNSAQYALEIRDLLAAVTDGNKEFWIH